MLHGIHLISGIFRILSYNYDEAIFMKIVVNFWQLSIFEEKLFIDV